MASQTLTIADTLDDAYEEGGTIVTGFAYIDPTNTPCFSFVLTAQIPSGSTIDSAYCRVGTLSTVSGSGTVTVKVETVDPVTAARWSGSHKPSTATFYTGVTSATVAFASYTDRYLFGASDGFPLNIAASIQSLLDTYGTIEIGDRINTAFNCSAGYTQTKDFSDGNPSVRYAQLIINWTPGSGGTVALIGSPITSGVGSVAPGIEIPL